MRLLLHLYEISSDEQALPLRKARADFIQEAGVLRHEPRQARLFTDPAQVTWLCVHVADMALPTSCVAAAPHPDVGPIGYVTHRPPAYRWWPKMRARANKGRRIHTAAGYARRKVAQPAMGVARLYSCQCVPLCKLASLPSGFHLPTLASITKATLATSMALTITAIYNMQQGPKPALLTTYPGCPFHPLLPLLPPL